VAGDPPGSSRRFPLPGDAPRFGADREFDLVAAEVSLALDLGAASLEGVAVLTLRRVEPSADEVALDAVAFEGLEVRRLDAEIAARLVGRQAAAPAPPAAWVSARTLAPDGVAVPPGEPAPFSYDGATLRVHAPPAAGVARDDEVHLLVRWRCAPRRGLYFLGPDRPEPRAPGQPPRPVQVWSQGQDEDTRHWLPCIDRPAARTRFALSATVPAKFDVLSNGRRAGRTDAGQVHTVRWATTEPQPPYLVTLVVAELDEVAAEADGVPLAYLAPRGRGAAAAAALARTPEMLRLFADRVGRPFPWEKYAQVVVDDFIFGGMENTSATTLHDRVLLDERAALDGRDDVEALVAHELAHQWFGDLLTCRDWSHGWLNEGFATFFEHVWREHADGADAYLLGLADDLDAWLLEDATRYRRRIVENRWSAPIDVFDRHLYQKGGLVLHALRRHLGDDAFWRGVRAYVARHAGGAVETHDLQRAFEDATGRALGAFFAQWVHRAAAPSLVVSAAHERGVLTVTVAQPDTDDADDTAPADDPARPFEAALHVEIDVGGARARHRLPLRRAAETFAIPCPRAPRSLDVDPELALPARLRLELPVAWLVASLAEAPIALSRVRAARALGARDDVAATRALGRALAADPSHAVRSACAAALAEQRSPAALEALLAVTGDPDPRARRALARALGAFVTREGAPHAPSSSAAADRLLALAAAGDPSWLVEAEVLRALGATRDPRARPVLERALERPSWQDVLRTGALEGLALSRDPAALPLLLAHARSGHPAPVRRAALAGLGGGRRLTSDEPTLARAREAAEDALEAFDPSVAIAAASALRELGHSASVAALERAAARAPDGRVRRRCRESLRDLRADLAGRAGARVDLDDLERLRDELRGLRDRTALLEARLGARDPAVPPTSPPVPDAARADPGDPLDGRAGAA
jgi:aminopeptidase N